MHEGWPTVLTVDPGFASLGYGVVRVERDRDVLLELGVVVTKPTGHKGLLKSEDQFRRLREQGDRLWSLARRYAVDAVCFESISIPAMSSKQGAIKIGHAYGMLALLASALDVPVVMVTPQAIKKAVCGVKDASKEDVELAMRLVWGHSTAAVRFMRDVAGGLHNHGWDALAAYAAAGSHEVMRAVKRGARGRAGGDDGEAEKVTGPGRGGRRQARGREAAAQGEEVGGVRAEGARGEAGVRRAPGGRRLKPLLG